MPSDLDPAALAGQLAAEHGDRLPPSLIRTAVDAVSASAVARDPLDLERVARADVAALAAAAARRPHHVP
ncbi:MAG: hypothetical protein ACLGIG_07145 [Actinomycetes bacterium]